MNSFHLDHFRTVGMSYYISSRGYKKQLHLLYAIEDFFHAMQILKYNQNHPWI